MILEDEVSNAQLADAIMRLSSKDQALVLALIECGSVLQRRYANDDEHLEQEFGRIVDYAIEHYADLRQEIEGFGLTETVWEEPAVEPEPSAMSTAARPCVYIIGCGGTPEMFKIGKADNLRQRLNQISTSNPFKPYVVHAFYIDNPSRLEAELHSQFAGKRGHGEWFELTDEDVIDLIDAGETLLHDLVERD